MAATSVAPQVQTLIKIDTEVERRVLVNAKEAADLDFDTIFNIALFGLEDLANIDERFQNHKHDLFSHKSRELDREPMDVEENNRINASITSYLRLLSGHLQSPSAFKILEYLVRRYKIHVYNTEELILCALPYHDTHAFVRIMQLIDYGNTRWRFLDGVKASGAAPPREVIVQQCIRDLSVLEVICNYATPMKKHQPSTPVIRFCTAVVVEALGSLATVDSDVVKSILPFLDSGLQFGGEESSDYKAGTLRIVRVLAKKVSDDVNVSVRLGALSAFEVLANKFPSNHTVFSKFLTFAVKNVLSDDLADVACCLRTCGTLISVLGPRALPELPQIMKNVLQKTGYVSTSSDKELAVENSTRPAPNNSVLLSILVTLEALVDNLGAFLNPYLSDLVELMVMHPNYISESSQKLKPKADRVRRLLSEKVPIRLALPALQSVYSKAVKSGDVSLCTVFELLNNFISQMDKYSVSGYHRNIFDLCLLALDLRSQQFTSVKNVNNVEIYVINAMIGLTMKMPEIMFKPLFIKSIEWAETNLEEHGHATGRNIRRAISFYGMVNKLAENLRSLFVPYFKYMFEGSIRYLTDDDGGMSGHSRKKKKAKLQKSENGENEANDLSSLEKWHLRALVLSSLHKCFLYDTGSPKFLDSSNFQLVLKPLVSQLAFEPPASLDDYPDIPSVKEVDDVLVSCVGQMAVTAGSDLLWKPLNREVLMQTRNEMVRSRVLGLKIVKYLVENLKEEYLVLLAETIPFLAELLEDVELPVRALAQEIVKELESMSGEDLREYF